MSVNSICKSINKSKGIRELAVAKTVVKGRCNKEGGFEFARVKLEDEKDLTELVSQPIATENGGNC